MQFGKKTIKRYLPNIGFHHSHGMYIHNDDNQLRLSVRCTKKRVKDRKAYINIGYHQFYLEPIFFNPEMFLTPEQLLEAIYQQYDKVKQYYTQR
jgi:hypothetical protein